MRELAIHLTPVAVECAFEDASVRVPVVSPAAADSELAARWFAAMVEAVRALANRGSADRVVFSSTNACTLTVDAMFEPAGGAGAPVAVAGVRRLSLRDQLVGRCTARVAADPPAGGPVGVLLPYAAAVLGLRNGIPVEVAPDRLQARALR